MSETRPMHNSARIASNAMRAAARRMFGTAEQKIRNVYNDFRRQWHSYVQPFSVWHVENRMRDFATANNIKLTDGDMYMSVKGITHARRTTKVGSGKAVTENAISKFPNSRSRMDLYCDLKKL